MNRRCILPGISAASTPPHPFPAPHLIASGTDTSSVSPAATCRAATSPLPLPGSCRTATLPQCRSGGCGRTCSRDRSVVSGQWSVVSGQWSVVSGQWSVVSGQHLCAPPRDLAGGRHAGSMPGGSRQQCYPCQTHPLSVLVLPMAPAAIQPTATPQPSHPLRCCCTWPSEAPAPRSPPPAARCTAPGRQRPLRPPPPPPRPRRPHPHLQCVQICVRCNTGLASCFVPNKKPAEKGSKNEAIAPEGHFRTKNTGPDAPGKEAGNRRC
jgi:hypothetical protein